VRTDQPLGLVPLNYMLPYEPGCYSKSAQASQGLWTLHLLGVFSSAVVCHEHVNYSLTLSEQHHPLDQFQKSAVTYLSWQCPLSPSRVLCNKLTSY
jgi:hypothetical protein